MNWADFMHTDINTVTESYFNNYWVGVVTSGCGPFGHGTLKSAVSQECLNDMS